MPVNWDQERDHTPGRQDSRERKNKGECTCVRVFSPRL